MPAVTFPLTARFSKTSRVTPMKQNIMADNAEDGTGYTRRFAGRYTIMINTDWILEANYNLVVAQWDSDPDEVDVTIKGRDYRGHYTSEPVILKQSGHWIKARVFLEGVRNGW